MCVCFFLYVCVCVCMRACERVYVCERESTRGTINGLSIWSLIPCVGDGGEGVGRACVC